MSSHFLTVARGNFFRTRCWASFLVIFPSCRRLFSRALAPSTENEARPEAVTSVQMKREDRFICRVDGIIRRNGSANAVADQRKRKGRVGDRTRPSICALGETSPIGSSVVHLARAGRFERSGPEVAWPRTASRAEDAAARRRYQSALGALLGNGLQAIENLTDFCLMMKVILTDAGPSSSLPLKSISSASSPLTLNLFSFFED